MSFNCSYSFCTAAMHNLEGCRNAVSKYFSKEYKGINYFICPTCSSYSTESFDTFLSEHGHHLRTLKYPFYLRVRFSFLFSIFIFFLALKDVRTKIQIDPMNSTSAGKGNTYFKINYFNKLLLVKMTTKRKSEVTPVQNFKGTFDKIYFYFNMFIS